MSDTRDRLYALLPAVYRIRDAEQGHPLRALLRVIGEQVDLVEADITQLYANWFIETCADWAVPYLGDLVGYRPVGQAGLPGDPRSPAGLALNRALLPRREVANTIRYRRRRGALALLEQLALDVAGWPARAVEFFPLTAATQAISYLQLAAGSSSGREGPRTADLRDEAALEQIGGPFDRLTHSADMRRIGSPLGPGRFNIPSVGLFVWRLRPYSVTLTPANRVDRRPNCFTFSVLGNNTPLITAPQPEADAFSIAGPLNLPAAITRRAFELNPAAYYGPDKSLCLYERAGPIDLARIVPADLSGWHYRPLGDQVAIDPQLGRVAFLLRHPPDNLRVAYRYAFSADIGGGEYDRPLSADTLGCSLFRAGHLLDPDNLFTRLRDDQGYLPSELRGRLPLALRQAIAAFGAGPADPQLIADLLAALNAAIQGDTLYNQAWVATLAIADEETNRLLRRVRQGEELSGPPLARLNRLLLEAAFPNEIAISYRRYAVRTGGPRDRPLSEALRRWEAERPRNAVIEIIDSGAYTEQIGLTLAAGQSLELRAADRCRPVLRLLNVNANDSDDLTVLAAPGSRITFDGLLVVGRGLRVAGDPDAVTLRHCTLVPGWDLDSACAPAREQEPSLTLIDSPPEGSPVYPGGVPAAPALPRLRTSLTVAHSIVGSILVVRDAVGKEPLDINIHDSIIDATRPDLEALSGPDCSLAHATLTIARCTVLGELHTHAIALGENSIFAGLVRVARSQIGCLRFSYAPPGSRTPRRYRCQPDLALAELPAGAGEPARAIARDQVRPQFTSARYGTPAYAQLALSCAEAIRRGADDESEMGAFHDLFQPQREANLRARLAEYTPAGMEAGMIFVS